LEIVVDYVVNIVDGDAVMDTKQKNAKRERHPLWQP
jgi:hypothetical protein